jgi:hypothetical protein
LAGADHSGSLSDIKIPALNVDMGRQSDFLPFALLGGFPEEGALSCSAAHSRVAHRRRAARVGRALP